MHYIKKDSEDIFLMTYWHPMLTSVVLWVTLEVWKFDINVTHVSDICITKHRIWFRFSVLRLLCIYIENLMFGTFRDVCLGSRVCYPCAFFVCGQRPGNYLSCCSCYPCSPFGSFPLKRKINSKKFLPSWESNKGPLAPQSSTLSTELWQQWLLENYPFHLRISKTMPQTLDQYRLMLVFSWCCRDLLTRLLRTVVRGLIMSIKYN